MYLKKLNIFHFKNHAEIDFSFSPQVNCFTGPNGSGKTNVLDAIHYLSLCKSFFTTNDSQNIQDGAAFFTIHGEFELKGLTEDIYCGLKQGQRKIIKRNEKEYSRLSEHIGLIPLVMIAPADQTIITGGSEERRKFLDSIICQADKTYLENLTTYQRILMQRNALLKQLSANPSMDRNALGIWDDQLSNYATAIFEARQTFIAKFQLLVQQYFEVITNKKEEPGIQYKSQLQQGPIQNLLASHLSRDLMMQYSTVGIHKDDLEFTIDGKHVRRFGSQGQQKSFVVSLKLAQFQYINQVTGIKPLLLLDDIFEKLDDDRMNKLLELVSADTFGQLFVTDTHRGRAENIFERLGKDVIAYHFEL